MVVSKDGKRKRKESPTVDSSPDIPKRTKVQAQRKFAQGQGNTSASYSLSSAIVASSSQANSFARDNKESIPELISHKKPIAEDLVTYLCFRGTPCLPPHLDFFNQNTKSNEKMKNIDKGETTLLNDESNNSNSAKKPNKKYVKKTKTDNVDNDGEEVDLLDKKNIKNEKMGSIGYAACKKGEQSLESNRKCKQNEKLVTLRERAKKFQTNRRSPRTRSAVNLENKYGDADSAIVGISVQNPTHTKRSQMKVQRKSSVQRKKTPRTLSAQLNKREHDSKNVSENKRNTINFVTPPCLDLPETSKQKPSSDLEDQTSNVPEKQITYLHEEIVSPFLEDKSYGFNPVPLFPGKQEILTVQTRKPSMAEKCVSKTIEKIEDSADNTSDINTKMSYGCLKKGPVKRIIKEKPKADQENHEEVVDITPPKPKRGRKIVEKTSKGNVPQVENKVAAIVNKTCRPMRKTKEAATIYMEWIGLKLNLDEDGSSLDSFPELPNARETQKIENELKKYGLKQNKPSRQTPIKRSKKNQTSTICKSISACEELVRADQQELEGLENIDKRKSFSDSDDEPLVPQKVEIESQLQTKVIRAQKKSKSPKLSRKKKPAVVAKKGKHAKNIVSLKNHTGFEEKFSNENCPEKNNENVVESSVMGARSYSDSDDEPLATKLVIKIVEKELKADPEPLQIITKITPVSLPPNDKLISPSGNFSSIRNMFQFEERPLSECLSSQKCLVRPSSQDSPTTIPPVEPSIVLPPPHRPDQMIKSIIPLPVTTPPEPFTPLERFPSPKVNPSFLTPKFDRNLERKLPAESVASTQKSNLPSPSVPKTDLPSTKSVSPSSCGNMKKFEVNPDLSANLMPSKEESGKIFGIASVSLAQSSGPDNTKCTLGKCGSIHKPVLGPVVPTEAYLGEPLSSRERRKAKVNMTHEQIQKWLIECSSNPDEIQDDLDDDFEEPLKPQTFAPTPPLLREEMNSSIVPKIGKELRSENIWTSKGPSLKATPVVMKDCDEEVLAKRKSSSESQSSRNPVKTIENPTEGKLSSRMTLNRSGSVSKLSREATKSPKPSTSSATSSPNRLKNTKTIPDNQKLLSVPRKPVYSTKPQTMYRSEKKPSNNSFSAFSPENETSVYSFDKEDDVPPPVAKPFRRHSRRESNADENISSDKHSKIEKIPSKETQQSSVSLMLSPEEGTKSIKVSLENREEISIANIAKPHGDTSVVGDSDSEGHTFYIPLQGTSAAGAHSGKADVIQGVAVKLGREGPEGPNQRVIMHATLVTKAQMGSNTKPIPESMNVHEIVKSLLSTNKEISTSAGSKNVPVGTVQPRFKSNVEGQIKIGSSLTRVNSNSSLLSASTKSKNASITVQKKPCDATPIKMLNNTAFPRRDDPTQMVEAPIFRPTDKEFQDPIEFIDRITPIAARFGICKIIPPDSFKPECRVSDDMRFTAYNQYVHKMLHRWGPSAKEFSAIKKYLATQSIAMSHPPWIGGMEVDLPRLYHTVQELGGLKEVIEKKKWARVAEEMCIPKLAQDRVTKLDDIYCKYLLPYDTLSPVERQKLFDEVEADWAKREARARRNADRCVNLESISNADCDSSENEETDEEVDGVSMECIVKGRSMPLNAFFRIARNTMALWFKNTEPTVAEIEAEFWRHVAVRDSHVCVHSGSIDSSGWGYGFPSPGPKTKGSQCAKHPWNLKILTNNAGSVLRSLGPVMGVTVPTLHVGMLFSACCWYRDPHGLSWIEYLHTGASKIWYGIPDEQSSKFRKALTALIPTHCQNKTIWLPCDTAMVPPHMLTDRGVSLCRVDQKPGEFVVVFPRAYTSSIATGYVVSESVYFATSSWLDSAKDDFKDIHESCEPAMFSLEQLLFAVANDQRASMKILSQVVPMLGEVFKKEVAARNQLEAAGLTEKEKLQPPAVKSKHKLQLPEEHECDFCRANLYISMIKTTEGNIYCLQHALHYINNGIIQAKQCTLIFTYDIEDIQTLITKIKDKLTQLKKKGATSIGTSKKAPK